MDLKTLRNDFCRVYQTPRVEVVEVKPEYGFANTLLKQEEEF